MDIRALQSRFQELSAQANALLERGEDLTAEDLEKVRGLNAEMATIRTNIESAKETAKELANIRQQAAAHVSWGTDGARLPLPLTTAPSMSDRVPGQVYVEGVTNAGQTILEKRNGIMRAVDLNQKGDVDRAFRLGAFHANRSDDYASAFDRMIRSRGHGLTGSMEATLQEGVDTSGGYLVPDEILSRIVAKEPTPTRVAGRVTSITTSRDALSMPKVNYSTDDLYTSGIRVTWTGEVPASATTHRVTEPVFGQIRVPVYTAMLSILVTNDLLEDAMVNLQDWLAMKFSETIDLLFDNMILNGTGVNQPMGILANPNATNHPATVNSGSASALTGDGLIDLTEALPEQYDEGAVLVFNKTNTGKAIRKLKDGDGRPLFNYGANDSGYASERMRDINGYPYIWSGFMPNVGTNTYPIIFGDLRGYYLVRRIGFSLQVLREVYAETNGILLLGRVRFGGMVAEDWRLKIQKCAA